MTTPRTVSVIGSTGSIGRQALDVIGRDPEAFRVVAIGANRSVDELALQAEAFRPEVVAIGDASLVSELAQRLPGGVEVRGGAEGLASLCESADVVLNAVVGFAGLGVTVTALELAEAACASEQRVADRRGAGRPSCSGDRGRRDRAGRLRALRDPPVPWRAAQPAASTRLTDPSLPPTSRGSSSRRPAVHSGDGTATSSAPVSVDDALAHPTWKMGPKITIDSSTLMNKGLEVIEAHALFGVDYDRIEVVIHPQSIVHSMVEFCDGATIAQLSHPDMRLPIGYALSYPDRFREPFGAIDWSRLSQLDFAEPDYETFACLGLAFAAGRAGGSAPAWLNAANEVAVAAFLVRSDRLARHRLGRRRDPRAPRGIKTRRGRRRDRRGRRRRAPLRRR